MSTSPYGTTRRPAGSGEATSSFVFANVCTISANQRIARAPSDSQSRIARASPSKFCTCTVPPGCPSRISSARAFVQRRSARPIPRPWCVGCTLPKRKTRGFSGFVTRFAKAKPIAVPSGATAINVSRATSISLPVSSSIMSSTESRIGFPTCAESSLTSSTSAAASTSGCTGRSVVPTGSTARIRSRRVSFSAM